MTTTFNPVADAYTDGSAATTNFGAAATLRVDGSPVSVSYLRFDVSGLGGPATSAVLRLYSETSHSSGYSVFGVASTSWIETGPNNTTALNFNNAPPLAATATGSSGALSSNSYREVVVTPLITGSGPVSIALRSTSSSSMTLSSRQAVAGRRPELVVTGGSPDTQKPSRPGGLTATAAGHSRIDLSWSASTDDVGVTGYRIRRNGSTTVLATATGTTYSDSGLSGSTSYSYTVEAIDAAGNASAESAPASATTAVFLDTQAPSVPTGVTATATSDTSIDLSWSASSDEGGVTEYRIRRNGSDTVLATATGTTFTDTGLTGLTAYSYTVQAVDAAGNASAQSAAASTTTRDGVKPSVPTGLTVSAGGGTRLELHWNASTDNVGVTGYRIRRDGSDTVLTTVTATTFTDSGLNPSTTYSYTVEAIDAAGNGSGQSAPVSSATNAFVDTEAPSVPAGVTATAMSDTRIDLSWSASADNVGVAGYRIRRNGSDTVHATATGTTFSDTGLSGATAYSYRVEAFDDAGNVSAQSDPASARTSDLVAPSVPAAVAATAVSTSRIDVSWSASTDNLGVTGYRIRRNGSATPMATVTTTTYSDTSVSAATTYSYSVQAIDAAGNASAQSAAASATTPALPPPSGNAPKIAAAGDVACVPGKAVSSGSCRQAATSDLLVAGNYAAVLPLGDIQYYCGALSAFQGSYGPTWGRVLSVTRPAVGNHEYLTSGSPECSSANAGAAGYFDYFGSRAGNRGQGYYSYDIGSWHLIALNSNCGSAGGCSTSNPQGQWLAADLAAHKNKCTLAYWHIPLFSSGGRANSNTQSFWNQLYAAGADVILTGHDHIYERFAKQNPSGNADPVNGIRQWVVGTGGANHTSLASIFPNSRAKSTGFVS